MTIEEKEGPHTTFVSSSGAVMERVGEREMKGIFRDMQV